METTRWQRIVRHMVISFAMNYGFTQVRRWLLELLELETWKGMEKAAEKGQELGEKMMKEKG